MLLLTVIGLFFLFYVAYSFEHKLLFPPVLFIAVWLLSLTALMLSGDLFYSITTQCCLIYLTGAIAFTIGGLLSKQLPLLTSLRNNSAKAALPSKKVIYRILDFFLLILIIGLPFYWQSVSRYVEISDSHFILNSLRAKMTSPYEKVSLGPIANLVVLAQFVPVAMYYEFEGTLARKLKLTVAIVLAIIYGAMTGTKGNVITLLLTLFFISTVRQGKVRLKSAVIVICLGVAFFSAGLLAVNFAYTSFSGVGEIFALLKNIILLYWLGGIVAFQYIAENPHLIESTLPIHRFFLETAHSLGFKVDVPPTHAEFLPVSPDYASNIYTIYFTYYKDFGFLGMFIIMVIIGFILTFLYRSIRRGNPVFTQFFAMMCTSIVLSFHSEKFFTGLNQHIKAIIFLLSVYYLIPLIFSRRKILRRHNA